MKPSHKPLQELVPPISPEPQMFADWDAPLPQEQRPVEDWGSEWSQPVDTPDSTTWGVQETTFDYSWESGQSTTALAEQTEESYMSKETPQRGRLAARVGSLATKFIKVVDKLKTKNVERMANIRSKLGRTGLSPHKSTENGLVLNGLSSEATDEPNAWDDGGWGMSDAELDSFVAKKQAEEAAKITEKTRAAEAKEAAYQAVFEAYDGPGATIRENAQNNAELRGKNITEIPNLVDAEDSVDLSPWGTSAEALFGENIEVVVAGAMERSPFAAESDEAKDAFASYFTENCLVATVIEDMLSGDIDKDSPRWAVLREYDGTDATLGMVKKAFEASDDVREKERAMMLSHLLEANATLFKEESLPMLGVSDEQVRAVHKQRLRLRAQFDAIIDIDGSALKDRDVMDAYAHMKPYTAQRELDDPAFLHSNLSTRQEYTMLDIRSYDSPVFHNTPYSKSILKHGSFVSSYKNAEMHGGKRIGPNSNASNLAHSVLPHWSETPTIFNNKPGFAGQEPAYRQESAFNGYRTELFSPATFVKSIGDIIGDLPVSRGAVFGVARIKSDRLDVVGRIPVPSRDRPERGYSLSPNHGDAHRDSFGDDREFLPARHTTAVLKEASLPVSSEEKVNIGAPYEQGKGMPDVSSAEALRVFTENRIAQGGNSDKYVVPLRVAKKLWRSESSLRNDVSVEYTALPVAA